MTKGLPSREMKDAIGPLLFFRGRGGKNNVSNQKKNTVSKAGLSFPEGPTKSIVLEL